MKPINSGGAVRSVTVAWLLLGGVKGMAKEECKTRAFLLLATSRARASSVLQKAFAFCVVLSSASKDIRHSSALLLADLIKFSCKAIIAIRQARLSDKTSCKQSDLSLALPLSERISPLKCTKDAEGQSDCVGSTSGGDPSAMMKELWLCSHLGDFSPPNALACSSSFYALSRDYRKC